MDAVEPAPALTHFEATKEDGLISLIAHFGNGTSKTVGIRGDFSPRHVAAMLVQLGVNVADMGHFKPLTIRDILQDAMDSMRRAMAKTGRSNV